MKPAEIRSIREKLFLTQDQLAQLLGVHSMTISKWERGLLQPSPHNLALITSFQRASRRNTSVGVVAAKLLMSEGISAALYHILRTERA